jgi:hypothetical protein
LVEIDAQGLAFRSLAYKERKENTTGEGNPMEPNRRELPIPPPLVDNPSSGELIRIWQASDQQHITLDHRAFQGDPTTWGLVLVDLARHVADAYERTGIMDAASALRRIREYYDLEWTDPTDTPRGSIGKSTKT